MDIFKLRDCRFNSFQEPLIQVIRTGQINRVKSLLGHNNHYLVTILVGLYEVENNRCPRNPAFSPSWNPNNVFVSAREAREHVLNMSLSWIIDGLDAYFRSLGDSPSIVSPAMASVMNGHKIFMKLNWFKDNYYSHNFTVNIALTNFAIFWRNKIVHSLKGKQLDSNLRSFLIANASLISNDFKGLDIALLIDDYNNDRPLVHKGVGGFIKAIQDLLYEFEYHVLNSANPAQYALAVIRKHFIENIKLKNFWDLTMKRDLRIKKYELYYLQITLI